MKERGSFWKKNRPVYEAMKSKITARFPDVFSPTSPMPLHLDIDDQLKRALPDESGVRIKTFLIFWTRRQPYLLAVAKGEHRFGIEGEPTALAVGHREHAWRWLHDRSVVANPAELGAQAPGATQPVSAVVS